MRANKASRNLGITQTEQDLRTVAKAVMAITPEIPTLPDPLREEIYKIADFVARARCKVERDSYTKEPLYHPEPEVPTRLCKQLCDLALGIAMAREKQEVTKEEIELVKKVALDSIPSNQLTLLKAMISFYPEPVKTASLSDSDEVKVTARCVQNWLDDLWLTGAVKKSGYSGATLWQLDEEDAEVLKGLL